MKTVVIRNNTNSEKIWLRTFSANESYTIPVDNSLVFKYANLEVLLAAIAAGEASIGDGDTFFTSINDQVNYLKGIDTSPRDSDSAVIIRPKAAKTGWTYHLRAIEFETSLLNSIVNKDYAGNNIGDCVIKFYDADGVELTDQQDCDTDCVKTVVDFEPTHDYEIIGGTLKTKNGTTDDYRIWIIGVPDIAAQYGGSKVMVNNVNLAFIDPNNGIEADGKVSKYMAYSATYHTNKLRLVATHPAGGKLKLMLAFEMFKA